jgi:hypothetical protein
MTTGAEPGAVPPLMNETLSTRDYFVPRNAAVSTATFPSPAGESRGEVETWAGAWEAGPPLGVTGAGAFSTNF